MANQALEERLAGLRASYGAKLFEKLDAIDASLRAAMRDGAVEHCDALWRVCHNLAGTAGSYGFGGLARVVHDMEVMLAPFRSTGRLPLPTSDALVLLLRQARQLVKSGSA